MNSRLWLAGLAVSVFAVLGLTHQGSAQAKRVIFLDCPGDDQVGRRLCFRVREEIRRSTAYSLGTDKKAAFVILRVHSVDKDTPPTGAGSAVSVLVTLAKSDSYLHDQILFVGSTVVDSAAVGIVADIDDYLEQLLKDAAGK